MLTPRDQCQVQIIRVVPMTLHQTPVNFTMSSPGYRQTGCSWWDAVDSWFHLDLKSFFALKNNCMRFLLGQTTWWLNVICESRMKWTWHHSNFAIHEVSFYHRLKVVLLQLLSIHDRAVGMMDLDIMLLWFLLYLKCEGHYGIMFPPPISCHCPMLTSRSNCYWDG